VLCKQKVDTDSADVIHEWNPKTVRFGFMHTFCYNESIELAKITPSNNINYDFKLEEIFNKFG